MPEPVIRRAETQDAEALAELGARTFVETFGDLYPADDLAVFLHEAYGLARTQADLADPAKAAWLLEVGGRPVGYALAGPCALPHPDVTPTCGELKRIYVLKACQGGGLGQRLFTETMAWLAARHAPHLWIGVWSENTGAQRLYRRHGFEKAGEYGFKVGRTTDLEFILRGDAARFATGSP